jgi:hypothetical protein
MTKPGRILVVAAIALLCFTAGAIAKTVKAHHHNSGHEKVAAALKKGDGVHQIEKKGKHTISAEVKNGKIAGIHVKHDTKGDVAVKKYKTHKKMASLEGSPSDGVPADTDMGTVYIAYAYVDDEGNEEYYWFPYEEILDGDTGAVEYVPLS